jgi:[ribosomal protein S18]-alanine N-acetyltransferase
MDTMKGLSFEPVSTHNYAIFYRLHQQGQYSPWSQKTFEDCLKPPYFAYSLNVDGVVVGYYIAMRVLDEVTLMDIVVDKQQQKKGYGQMLLAHLLEQCAFLKIQQVWLEVRESNQAAIYLYEKHHFLLVEQRANYYPSEKGKEDAYIMCAYIG